MTVSAEKVKEALEKIRELIDELLGEKETDSSVLFQAEDRP